MALKRRYYWIDRVGVELEGGWRKSVTRSGIQIGNDGSVKCGSKYDGEVASPPLKPREIVNWMHRNYPDVVNGTCGLHVHLSVAHRLAYARLQEVAFRDYMLDYLRKWGAKHQIRNGHPFWGRLNGRSYCAKKHHPERQIFCTDKDSDRYTQLNYCWSLHGTLENRTLAGFARPHIGAAAVLAVVNCTEDYLRQHKQKIKPVYVNLQSEPEPCTMIEDQFTDDIGNFTDTRLHVEV